MAREQTINSLRASLLQRRAKLLGDLTNHTNYLKDSQFDVGDFSDLSCNGSERDLSAGLAEHESRELQKINDALGRISDGSYGVCEDCEGEIPLARLQALPYATCCVQCQAQREPALVW